MHIGPQIEKKLSIWPLTSLMFSWPPSNYFPVSVPLISFLSLLGTTDEITAHHSMVIECALGINIVTTFVTIFAIFK